MNNKTNYNFDVECLEAGQRRRYGDSYYHYIVRNNNKESEYLSTTKGFCTNFLSPAISEEEYHKRLKERDEFGDHFTYYYTSFKKLEDGSYEYKVVHPSTH